MPRQSKFDILCQLYEKKMKSMKKHDKFLSTFPFNLGKKME